MNIVKFQRTPLCRVWSRLVYAYTRQRPTPSLQVVAGHGCVRWCRASRTGFPTTPLETAARLIASFSRLFRPRALVANGFIM